MITSPRTEHSRVASSEHLLSYQETGSVLAAVISLHVQGSFLERDLEESHSVISTGLADSSASVEDGKETSRRSNLTTECPDPLYEMRWRTRGLVLLAG